MRFLWWVLNQIIVPLGVSILAISLTAGSSWWKTGSWDTWLRAVPFWVWIVASALLLVWITFNLTRAWGAANASQGAVGGVVVSPGWSSTREQKFGELHYAGVVWDVMVDPGGLSNRVNIKNPPSERIRVKYNPRCPDCGTEIDEEKKFWGSYVWDCPACTFDAMKDKSFIAESSRAEKVAKSEVR